MRYTNKELAIIEAIAVEQETLGADKVSLDGIVEAVAPKLDPEGKQARFRGGVNACLRNLERKLRSDGLTLAGSGEVGRGNKAYYSIGGSYRDFLNSKLREGTCSPNSTSSSIGSKTASVMNA